MLESAGPAEEQSIDGGETMVTPLTWATAPAWLGPEQAAFLNDPTLDRFQGMTDDAVELDQNGMKNAIMLNRKRWAMELGFTTALALLFLFRHELL